MAATPNVLRGKAVGVRCRIRWCLEAGDHSQVFPCWLARRYTESSFFDHLREVFLAWETLNGFNKVLYRRIKDQILLSISERNTVLPGTNLGLLR